MTTVEVEINIDYWLDDASNGALCEQIEKRIKYGDLKKDQSVFPLGEIRNYTEFASLIRQSFYSRDANELEKNLLALLLGIM